MFGRNVASYKFALGSALLEIAPVPGQLVTLEELAGPFSDHLCRHLRIADKQGTFPNSGEFLNACRKANAGELERENLIGTTVRLGFGDVIKAFHVVGQDDVPCRFFLDERRKGIRITDAFGQLMQSDQASNLPRETEARWRLVETAWELRVARALLAVEHDSETEMLFTLDGSRRRKSIAGARDALSAYQKGHCFYCFGSFSLMGPKPPDVDHFFPHTLKNAGFGGSVDGVWNLVLSCLHCNRGRRGKFDRIPTLKLLERLSSRNEFLIESKHPLRETLIRQAGTNKEARRQFLNDFHRDALAALIHEWESVEVMEPVF
jgi:HNH endonuclease